MADPDRWDRLSELVETASGIAPAEREAFLRARTNDAALREEVLSLLATSVHPDIFNKPAFEWFAASQDPDSFPPQSGLPKLLVGERVAGRFRLLGFLGRGGMAEVYEAHDDMLEARVALKLLDPGLAEQPGFLDRFKREIRLARQVSHPNVARVHDLVEAQDHPQGHLYFYVMELIAGETLGARLKREGPLAVAEALVVARQLAAGLNAAHMAGVIHRDFKPGNILLADGRAVITDFGLAAPIPSGVAEVQLKTTSLLLGTPGYVAPEQWAGQAASAATDIYSFGIVLHEMVTGRHPNSKAGGPAPNPEWAAVIAKCLALDPKARWRTSVEAVDALEPGWITRRNLLLAVGLAGTASLAALGTRYYKHRLILASGARVMIAQLENDTRDASLSAWPSALARQLDLSRQVQPVEESVERNAARLRELAMRKGIPLLAFSSVTALGGDLSLNVRLELMGSDVNYPSRVWRKTWHASGKRDLLRLAGEAGEWIRETTGESEAEIRSRSKAPEVLTSESWDALTVFSAALEAKRKGELTQSLALYKEAERIDPNFALAAAKVSDLQAQLSQIDASLASQARAVALLRSKSVITREALQIRMVHAVDSWAFKEGADAAELYQSFYPTEAPGYFFAAEFHRLSGRYEQAVPLYSMTMEKDRNAAYVADKLVWVLLAMRKFNEAEDVIRSERKSHDSTWLRKMDGIRAWVIGDFQLARQTFESIGGLTDSAEITVSLCAQSLRAILQAELGQFDQAIEEFEKLLERCRRLGRTGESSSACIHLAELALFKGQADRAASYAEASASMGGYLAELRAVEYLIRSGRRTHTLVRNVQFTSSAFPRILAAQQRVRGELALSESVPTQALNHFKEAVLNSPSHLFPDGLLRSLRVMGHWEELNELKKQLRAQSATYFGRAFDYPPGGLARLG